MRRFLAVLLFALAAVPAQAQSRAVVKWHSSHPLWMLRGDIVTAAGVVTPGSGAGGVGLGGTNVWTGSNTFTDSLFFIVDDGDPTKKIAFQASGITTGNTVTPITFVGTAAAPQIQMFNGVAATPPIRFASDQSGFWQRAATVFDVSIAGTSLMEFGSGGANQTVGTGLLVGRDLAIGFTSAATPASAGDAVFIRDTTASIQMGLDVNGNATAQALKGPDGITGSDRIGGSFTAGPGKGTGSGAGAQYNIVRNLQLATGTTQQSQAHAFAACETKTLSNTSATLTNIASVALASNSGGGVRITVSVRCDDGTNFDSDLVTSYVAFVNKAGTLTIGTAVTTASAAANNSGSCTVAPTFTAGTNSVDINVTPVITTITPTTTTAAVNIENFGAGAVTCK